MPPQTSPYQTIEVRRVRFASLFAALFKGALIIFGPFILLCGIAALFGAQTVEVGGKHVTGLLGLVEALIMIPLFAASFALMLGAIDYIGIRASGRFFPTVIEYVPCVKNAEPGAPDQRPCSPLTRT